MAENSKIQWTDHTFNPWRGCQKVAPGCANCYAETLSKRNSGTLGIWGPNRTRVLASEAMWREPVKWDRDAETTVEAWPNDRPRVFCASLADVFEERGGIVTNSRGQQICWDPTDGEQVLTEDLDLHCPMTLECVRERLFRLIDATPNLDWLLLTKRPENVLRMWWGVDGRPLPRFAPIHRPNVWLGTSVACQEDADRNIPELLKCRDLCAKLFLSVEPMVGPVDLCSCRSDALPGTLGHLPSCWLRRLDWVIVGGESGPHARPYSVRWIRSIVRQCRAAGVPVFVKQLGAFVIDRNDAGFDGDSASAWPGPQDVAHHIHGFREDFQGADCRVLLRDPKGGDMSEWPEDLWVREFPEAQR